MVGRMDPQTAYLARFAADEKGPLFLGFGLDRVEMGDIPGHGELIRREYEQRDTCWAHGLFLTVGPDGSVYPCMELNCDRRWVLGNLKWQSVEEVYRSSRRMEFLEMANHCRWGAELFHPHSRTARLDRIARAVRTGELTDNDIERICELSQGSHPLILN